MVLFTLPIVPVLLVYFKISIFSPNLFDGVTVYVFQNIVKSCQYCTSCWCMSLEIKIFCFSGGLWSLECIGVDLLNYMLC